MSRVGGNTRGGVKIGSGNTTLLTPIIDSPFDTDFEIPGRYCRVRCPLDQAGSLRSETHDVNVAYPLLVGKTLPMGGVVKSYTLQHNVLMIDKSVGKRGSDLRLKRDGIGHFRFCAVTELNVALQVTSKSNVRE